MIGISPSIETQTHFEAYATALEEPAGAAPEAEALARTVVGQFEQYIKLNKKIAPEVLVSINQIDDPNKLADTVAAHLSLKIPEKQELLETAGTAARLERVYRLLYCRGPSAFEQSHAVRFLADYQADLADVPADRRLSQAWAAYVRVLMSSNEFVYVD